MRSYFYFYTNFLKDRDNLESEISQLHDRCFDLERNVSVWKDKANHLENAMTESEDNYRLQIQSLEDSLKQFSVDSTKSKELSESSAMQIEELEKEIHNLQFSLSEANSKVGVLELQTAEMSALSLNYNDLKNALENVNEEKSLLESHMVKLEAQMREAELKNLSTSY